MATAELFRARQLCLVPLRCRVALPVNSGRFWAPKTSAQRPSDLNLKSSNFATLSIPFLRWGIGKLPTESLCSERRRRLRKKTFSQSTMASQAKTWMEEKERLAKLSATERRMNYFCGENFTAISEVKTWREYYYANKKSLTEKVSEKDMKQFMEVHPDLVPSTGKDYSSKVSLYMGDITKLEVDAIVNAANKSLLGGGGVDGAIHRGAGKLLLAECETLKGCETGSAKITSGYKLPAKYVIHTVGPVGEKPDLLRSCYDNSLDLMLKNNLQTIAFPCISTGVYGYPSQKAAPVALESVRSFIANNFEKVDRVVFCLFLDKDVEIYERLMQLFFPLVHE